MTPFQRAAHQFVEARTRYRLARAGPRFSQSLLLDEVDRVFREVDLLRPFVYIDPWGSPDSEYGESSCHFCGSDLALTNDTPARHRPTCIWMIAVTELNVDHPGHEFYVVPPADPPCPTCGWQTSSDHFVTFGAGPDSTGTYNGHEAHQAAEAGLTIREWRQRLLSRPYWDSLPVMRAPRGGIRFITPLPLTVEFGRQVGVVDHIEETESGLVVAGTVDDLVVADGDGYQSVDKPVEPDVFVSGDICAPVMPMYDFLGLNSTPAVDYCTVCWHALPCDRHE